MVRFTDSDTVYMREALGLALRGQGQTHPNPMVGAVVVKNGRVIGRGYHRVAGGPHAEVLALHGLSALDTRGACVYVTLEPCVHYGRTPPCVPILIFHAVSRVVCAVRDPNPTVSGKGIAALRQAGVSVSVGCLERDARSLNEQFFSFHAHARPFVALKFASSLDGKIATRSVKRSVITDAPSRDAARRLRAWYHAVLVGSGTVLSDNPYLGVRTRGVRDSVRIILDSSLRIPLSARVFRDANVCVATCDGSSQTKRDVLRDRGIRIFSFPGTRVPLDSLLSRLFTEQIISVLVEGGSEVLGSFVDQRLCDKVYAFHAPCLIGGKDVLGAVGGQGAVSISQAIHLRRVSYRRVGTSLLTIGYPNLV